MTGSPATTTPPGPTTGSGGVASRRALTRAVPVTLAVVLVATLAMLISPALRHQVALSFRRQPDPYVELYFADQTSARACPVVDGRVPVQVSLRSHLTGTTTVPWTVTVTASSGQLVDRAAGAAVTHPGTVSPIAADLAVPNSAYTVAVALTDRTERLAIHCAAGSQP